MRRFDFLRDLFTFLPLLNLMPFRRPVRTVAQAWIHFLSSTAVSLVVTHFLWLDELKYRPPPRGQQHAIPPVVLDPELMRRFHEAKTEVEKDTALDDIAFHNRPNLKAFELKHRGKIEELKKRAQEKRTRANE